MIHWQPFAELMNFRQAIDKFFEESFVSPFSPYSAYRRVNTLSINLYQANKAALPRVKPEEVDIAITGDTLTIKDEIKADAEVKQEDCYCQKHR